MKYNSIIVASLAGFVCLGSMNQAVANQVTYVVNKPLEIVYQVARQNAGQQPVFEARQMIKVKQFAKIPVALNGYQFAGIVTDNIDGHELPENAKEFGKESSCSLRTDSQRTIGVLTVAGKPHEITCKHS